MKKLKRTDATKRTGLFLIIILSLLFIVTLLFIGLETGLIKFNIDKTPAAKEFVIKDECSIIAGKIIHPIDRIDGCTNKCNAECEVRGYRYDNITFEEKENSCNTCECFCK